MESAVEEARRTEFGGGCAKHLEPNGTQWNWQLVPAGEMGTRPLLEAQAATATATGCKGYHPVAGTRWSGAWL